MPQTRRLRVALVTQGDSGGSQVALVDACQRRSSVARRDRTPAPGPEGVAGLATVLIEQASAADAIQPWGRAICTCCPRGRFRPNSSELFGPGSMATLPGPRSMATLLAQLARQYDVVLIDTPPLLHVTDAAILAWASAPPLIVDSHQVSP